jgi:hypothetical protein
LYGRETWFLALRKEHKLRVLENRLRRRIFAPEDERTLGLENIMRRVVIFTPPDIRMIKSRRMRWTGHVGRMVI